MYQSHYRFKAQKSGVFKKKVVVCDAELESAWDQERPSETEWANHVYEVCVGPGPKCAQASVARPT